MILRWQDRIRKQDAWLLSFLNMHKIPFVIFGGAAVAFHGCRVDYYFEDIDVLLCPTEANSRKFALAMNSAAKAAGKNVVGSFPPMQMAKMDTKFNLDVVEFKIDFVTMFKTSVFNDLMKGAVTARIGLLEVKVVSLQDAVWLKEKGVNDARVRLNYFAEDADRIKSSIAARVN